MRRFLILFLAVLLLASLAVPAWAQPAINLKLILKDENTPLPGCTFEIFRVGEAAADGSLILTGAFAGYPVIPQGSGEDSSEEAAALYTFAKKDSLPPDILVETDASGAAIARGLSSGLYLVAGQPLRHGGSRYYTEPLLILLPQRSPATGQIQSNTTLYVKVSREPDTQEPVSRKVLKIWDDHSGHIRPKSVTVHLLKNGSIHSTVKLTAKNQWRHTWKDLDPDALWQIAEDVPEGYTMTVQQEGSTFLLTNTAPEAPPPETTEPAETTPPVISEGRIPQTGTLWWPIAVLAVLGVLLIAGGRFLRSRFGTLLVLLGIGLLAAALFMTAGSLWQQQAARETSRAVMTRLELPPSENLQMSADPLSPTETPDYQYNPHMEMPETVIDGTAYIGTLEIPVLELQLPIAGTTTGENLQKAPCRYSGSTYEEDLILGAHNYDAHFGRLKQLSYGDWVRVTDLDGNVFSYQVADIEILQPEQLEDLVSSDWPLTLYTCTPGGQSRVTIRCGAINHYFAGSAVYADEE